MIRTILVALLAAAGIANALAQGNYPNRPIRWVIPYAAGGGTDAIARPIALKLGEVLGQPIVYENRGGGGGTIAGEIVAKSAPDGYTLLVGGTNTHVFASLLYDKLGYDPVKDYATVTNFTNVPNVLAARPAFPPKTLQELVAYGRANSGKINWASAGNGSGGHLALLMFAQQAGFKVVHVPFNGAGPATIALLGDQSDLLYASLSAFQSQIRAGKLRPLAQGGLQRLDALPDVPTFDQSGFPGFQTITFYGLYAPAGTPRPIIDKLHDELVKIIKSPESVARLVSIGAIPVANTPEQFAEDTRPEVAKWARIIKENNIKVD